MSGLLSGGCLCGAVRFKAKPEADEIGACHCSMCRKWSGGVFLGVTVDADVEFESETALGVYSASEWGERVFCKTCGSSLIWRAKDGFHTTIAAGAFDPPADFQLVSEIFIEEKPQGYAFANETKQMTGAEVFALFAPKQD